MGIAELLSQVDGSGEFGVWLGRLDGVPVFVHEAERPHYSASTMKLPVAMAMMRKVEAGELALDRPVTVHNDFESAAGGRFGVNPDEDEAPATWTRLGAQVPLGWLATEMITRSSNLATDLVLEQVGVDAAHRALAESTLRSSRQPDLDPADDRSPSGASKIQRGIDDSAAQRAGISNLMSPAGLAGVLVAVGNQEGASGDYLRDLLAGNQWNGEIPAELPAGTRVEHKNGWDTRIRHDGGIVRPADADPFVLVVCTTSDLPDSEAQQLIASIALEAWNHRHDLKAVR
ncbi:beta-lactamase class A [Kribbella aluminosa]|uniref:Beta-lactamase class A n=1 Tax=Kribbella aluminosa TaxID=416017 RepID=A0ABS4V079_9ACTN|nr:serine hydrolase [Kribbella aluminosa]MBP2357297.1 beta-lactamase class A [Kribbella aluminosa]